MFHVKMFNFAMKVNEKNYEQYIVNAFSYTLKDTTLNWCHNYMSKKFDYSTFSKFTQTFCKRH